MRKANLTVSNALLEKRLAETHMRAHDRTHALMVMRDAETIADVIVWAKERIASLGAVFLKPVLKN